MSGRSAHVRKKIGNEATKDGKNASRNHPPPPPPLNPGGSYGPTYGQGYAHSYDYEDVALSDFPMPGSSLPVGTGVGTTNARFLKFSEPLHDAADGTLAGSVGRRNLTFSSAMSISSGGSSAEGRRETSPIDEFDHDHDQAWGLQRKQTLRTEDVSGIERSGLRSMLDKKSEGVRKGIAKTLAFRKKDKDARRDSLDNKAFEQRSPTAATMRPQGAHPLNAIELPGGEFGTPAELESRVPISGSVPLTGRRLTSGTLDWNPNNDNMDHMNHGNPWAEPPPPPPIGKLPHIPTAQPPPMKRWVGGGRPAQRWNKLRKDPELWDPNGDVLVYFGHRGQTPKPNPSFRLSSHIIEATESRPLITMLREGSTEEDLDFQLPPSPRGAPPLPRHDRRRGTQHHHGKDTGPAAATAAAAAAAGGQPSPPASEDNSVGDADGQISYEMYFPTPSGMSKVDQFRHHITTRNMFALFYHASLVGISLYQALSDLHARLDAYMPAKADNVETMVKYLAARGLDDVRGEPETAVGLLAWTEGPEVRWEEGWRESFVHCAGMMHGRLERCADFRNLTPVTRALLERASLETQLRVQAAEDRLGELQCPEMWPSSGRLANNNSQAKAAAERFQKFLLKHYSRIYGSWPPPLPADDSAGYGGGSGGEGEEGIWLTRTVAQALQRDLGALYDYLVNRDIVWDESEARSGRKWMMVSESGNRAFEADISELPMTDMLVEFDNKMRFPHIPHPYPLVPESMPGGTAAAVAASNTGRETSFMFKSSKKSGGNAALERRVQLAYTEATNIYALGTEFTQSDLIDAFVKFEKTDRIGEVDPAVARRGRWVLLYGLLQTLASVSVDVPSVRYREGVPYHLSARLRGSRVPPWKVPSAGTGTGTGTGTGGTGSAVGRGGMDEAAHELSHCWVAPASWVRVDDEHEEEYF
ncbi:hypothetical protein SODALDRAFT_335651 [Sodiomyces alkalinus F11]|uniref:DUF8004 domain-containing protein n=1 Tax=Sodiomyces alkalinus (strain CBS 110278 / VKM F-3762 / F11) TaxID=1314773 RepID=A0A3N2PPX5_SODAK|nr:hypothetical protein SODALDRAFT_335651 [Sodiomyces alkalinus F11]ROT36551.1 hypothetical protein SODALDRAFT_335651 [Sodiomyces alkalinus F11]